MKHSTCHQDTSNIFNNSQEITIQILSKTVFLFKDLQGLENLKYSCTLEDVSLRQYSTVNNKILSQRQKRHNSPCVPDIPLSHQLYQNTSNIY